MRMSMPGRTTPLTRPDRSKWTRAGKDTGKAARTRKEARGQKAVNQAKAARDAD